MLAENRSTRYSDRQALGAMSGEVGTETVTLREK